MKKIIFGLFIFLVVFIIGVTYVHANNECTLTMENGASIRTTGNQGIRFRAKASSLPDGSTHGFYVVLGTVSKDDLANAITNDETKINDKDIVKKEITGNDLTFSVIIYNITSTHYEDDITALAYVKLSNGTYVFPTNSFTSNIMNVAKKAYELGEANDYIRDIFHSKYVRTKYNLDYGYTSIDEMRDALMDDFNEFGSTNYTLDSLKDSAGTQSVRNSFSEFIGNSNYSKKWYWLFDYIATLREDRYEEIESFARDNYDKYIERNNINYYTPCMQAIVRDYANASGLTGYDSSKRLWILEIAAFFNHDGYSYWSAVTFDWAQEMYDEVYEDILSKSKIIYEETTLKNTDITYEPTRDGYTFDGWYIVNNTSFIEKKTKTNAESEELHAAWIKSGAYFVDSSLDGSITNLRYEDMLFKYNVTAFKTISDAITKCTSGGTIYVNSGTYSANLTIPYNNITLIGVNSGINANSSRASEANITGNITINSGVSNLTIDGFKFSGTSKIVNVAGAAGTAQSPATNLNGFNFLNNRVETSLASGNGFIYFVESASSYSHDLVFKGNYFECKNNSSTLAALLYLDNFYNFTFTDNYLKNSPNKALYVNDKTKGASGKYVIIRNNVIDNSGTSGIHLNWLSPHPNETDCYVDISHNEFTGTGENAIYLGKFNNTDTYEYITINNNTFNDFYNGVYVMRSINNVPVEVSGNEFHGIPHDFYIKLDNTEASNPHSVSAYENLYYDNNDNINFDYALKFDGNISHSTLLYITHDGNGTIKLNETYTLHTNINSQMNWSSSNALVASVTNGVVTGLSSGNATITATAPSGATASIGVTVYNPSEVSELMQLLIDNHNGTIWNQDITYIGYQGNVVNNINGSANNYYPGSIPSVTNRWLPENRDNYSGVTISNLLYITIHDTGSSSKSSNASANANWCINSTNTNSSWHYTIGNDGIYHQVPDTVVAWHAGDGRSTATLQDTGISVPSGVTLRYRPTITMGNDGYFYLDGAKTNVKYPAAATPATGMNYLGIGVVVKNGKYYIPTTRITSQYGKVVAINGGNMQSIGIETCVNDGSDVYLTWQYTAKFVAGLLVSNNLGPDRVMFHNNFANKTCPNTMINSNKVETFLDMCYVEYMVRKYYSDYDITFTSLNQTYLDNNGRVKLNPDVMTSVGYTITITKGNTTEEITLYSSVSAK